MAEKTMMIKEETKTKIAWVGLYLGITLFIFGTGMQFAEWRYPMTFKDEIAQICETIQD